MLSGLEWNSDLRHYTSFPFGISLYDSESILIHDMFLFCAAVMISILYPSRGGPVNVHVHQWIRVLEVRHTALHLSP